MTKTELLGYLNRWGLPAFAIAAVFMILLFLASLVLIYVGDEYVSPGWNAASVPPPKPY